MRPAFHLRTRGGTVEGPCLSASGEEAEEGALQPISAGAGISPVLMQLMEC